jgi:hypothetical protein
MSWLKRAYCSNKLTIATRAMAAHTKLSSAGWRACLANETAIIPTAPVKLSNWYTYPLDEMASKLTSAYAINIAAAPYHPITSTNVFDLSILLSIASSIRIITASGACDEAKVWTSYLSHPKSKLKNHLFSGVVSVRILWLGMSLSTGTP